MKIVIFTEGGRETGFGHTVRCSALSAALRARGMDPRILIKGDKSVRSFFDGAEYEIVNWLCLDRKVLEDITADADMIIIDSYLAKPGFYEYISEKVKLPVYIDDDNRIAYPRGIVINGSLSAKKLGYVNKAGLKHVLGAEYIMLNRTFHDVPEKVISRDMRSVMVTFGGSDPCRMTSKTLRFLVENYPHLTKKVIIGRAFDDVSKIEKEKDSSTQVILFPNVGKMLDIMMEADTAISAGGQTLYELARIGVPTIAVTIADNQLSEVETLEKDKILKYAGPCDFPGIWEKVSNCMDEFKEVSERRNYSKRSRELIDGHGAYRIADLLLREATCC